MSRLKHRVCRLGGAGLALLLVAAQPAFGQTYPIAVGGARPPAPSGKTLDVAAEVFEAYDDDSDGDLLGSSPLLVQQSGFYTAFSPQLSFQAIGERALVRVTAGSSARYYRDGLGLISTGHFLGAGFTAKLGRHTTAALNQAISYAPSYLNGLFANATPQATGDAIPPAFDYAQTNLASYAYETTGGVTRDLTSRASVALNGRVQVTNLGYGPAQADDFLSYEAGGRVFYSLNRNAKMRLGYSYRRADYSALTQLTENGLEVGIDYSRPLSATRRTSMSIALLPKMLDRSEGPASDRRYGLAGDATITHQLGRTWTATGAFHRGVDFVADLSEAVLTNGVTATAAGLLTRRVDLSLLAAGSFGTAYGGAPFRTSTADVRLRFALTRVVAASLGYLFYLSDFDKTFVLPPGVSSRLTRNSVRVGLTFQAPLRH